MYHYNFGKDSVVVDHELTADEINAYIAMTETTEDAATLEDRIADIESALEALLSGRTE